MKLKCPKHKVQIYKLRYAFNDNKRTVVTESTDWYFCPKCDKPYKVEIKLISPGAKKS